MLKTAEFFGHPLYPQKLLLKIYNRGHRLTKRLAVSINDGFSDGFNAWFNYFNNRICVTDLGAIMCIRSSNP